MRIKDIVSNDGNREYDIKQREKRELYEKS